MDALLIVGVVMQAVGSVVACVALLSGGQDGETA